MVIVGVGDIGFEWCVKLGVDGSCRMFLNINFDVFFYFCINLLNI